MKLREFILRQVRKSKVGARLLEDRHYGTVIKAVISLIFNLVFAFYNGILGILSLSPIFVASAVYYLLLSAMRFSAVMLERKRGEPGERLSAGILGCMLIVLSVVFHIIVLISMKYQTAAVYGTITMITIATFTFTKITSAVITAVKHRKLPSRLIKAINAVRYSEVAVSILTMQQSMLVSFGEEGDTSAVILNAFTGAGVFIFIFLLGLLTLRNSGKETNYE